MISERFKRRDFLALGFILKSISKKLLIKKEVIFPFYSFIFSLFKCKMLWYWLNLLLIMLKFLL